MWVVTWVAPKCKPPILLLFNLGPDHLLLTELMCFHAQPTCLARTSFHSEWWRCSHGGSQDFCEDILPLLHGDHQALSLLSLSHRNLSLPLLLWTSSQPNRVAEPGGKLVVWGGGWDALSTPAAPAPALWIDVKFDPHCPSPIVLSAGVWPIPVCTRFYSNTAMPSCPSQEGPGEASVQREAGVTGCSLLCELSTFIHGACSSVLMCWCIERGMGLHVWRSLGPTTMTLTSWCPQGLISFPSQWLIQSIQVFLTLGVWHFNIKSSWINYTCLVWAISVTLRWFPLFPQY